jgi:8-oxo-dGTP pyrophosphatase MutT (NUDIX family)
VDVSEVGDHLLSVLIGASSVGSGIYRQSSVSKGRYGGATVATVVASLVGIFGVKYVSDGRYDLYASFSIGCWLSVMVLSHLNRRDQERSVPRAAGMILIGADDKILGVKAPEGTAGWSLPACVVARDEAPLEAAHRAVLVEVGARAQIIDIPPYIAWDDHAKNVVTMYFGRTRGWASSGTKLCRWIDKDELRAGAYPDFNTKALEHMQRHTVVGAGGRSA